MAQDLSLTKLEPARPAALRRIAGGPGPGSPAAGAPAAEAAASIAGRAIGIHPEAVLVEVDDARGLGDLAAGDAVEVTLGEVGEGTGATAGAAGEGALRVQAVCGEPGAGGAPGGRLLRFTGLTGEARSRIEAFVTRNRKADHIRICRDDDVRAEGVTTGFERYRLPHEALPELSKAELATAAVVLGKRLGAPILISCMTGGSDLAKLVNRRLARAAEQLGFALGLGSQRALLSAPELLDTYAVRDLAPTVLLFGNVGAVQLNYGLSPADCDRLVAMVGADALALHLNPLQEAVQPEGDTDFRGLKAKVATLASHARYPVVLKEVGNGIGPGLSRWVAETRLAGVDVAGAGGTSWSKVESYRARDAVARHVGRAFAGWGWPTAEAVRAARAALPDRLVVASGGIQSGIDCAKAIALGADLVGLARPFLEAATRSDEAPLELGRRVLEELRVAMFCVGAKDIDALRAVEMVEQ